MMPTIKEKRKERKGKERKNEIHLENDWVFSRPMFTRVFFFFCFFFTRCNGSFFFNILHVIDLWDSCAEGRGGTKSSEIGEGCRIFWISTVFSRISLKRQRSFSCASRFSARGASSMQGFGSATTRSCYRSLLSALLSLSFSLFLYLLLSRSLSVLLIFEHN